MTSPLPITILVAAKDEAVNIERCLSALGRVERVVVLDSHSTDQTATIARRLGAEVVQFDYHGGYPKKRQWALDTLRITSPWVMMVDADEVVPEALWQEIAEAITSPAARDGYLITKGFHFLGRRFRYGGFSFAAVVLFRTGKARFERLADPPAGGQDMEVHERVLVDGTVGRLQTPLIHEDFKNLEAYLHRHNKYSTWEANVRYHFLTTGRWGPEHVAGRLRGNVQEKRRWLKSLALRMPLEPLLWFVYHYFFRLGMLEGRRGLIACQIRRAYIAQVRAKLYERRLAVNCQSPGTGETPLSKAA